MTVTVRKTITEHTNGRRRSETSPTGWERRIGVKSIGSGRTKTQVALWEPCEGPKTYDYGSEGAPQGGTVHTEIDGLADLTLPPLYAGEARMILASFCSHYSIGMSIFYGDTYSHDPRPPHQAYRDAQAVRARALELFGIDLESTNLVQHPA